MPTLKEYNTRLAAMNGMRRVTSTMQMVAASHLHRIQRAMPCPVAFGAALTEILKTAQRIPIFAGHRFMRGASGKKAAAKEPAKILLIVMCSDRGLCGAFNHGIAVDTRQWVEEQRAQRNVEIEALYVGKKGAGLLARELPSSSPIHTFSAQPKLSELLPLADTIAQRFMDADVDEVWFSGARFINTLRHNNVVQQILPFAGEAQPQAMTSSSLLEPDDARLVETLMRHWIHYCLLVSQQHRVATEQASRVLAMSSATENLKTMEKDLKLRRNRARQTAITSELIEIIAGAESLN